MRQVGDTLVWLAMIGVVAAVVYFTPRLASYVGCCRATMPAMRNMSARSHYHRDSLEFRLAERRTATLMARTFHRRRARSISDNSLCRRPESSGDRLASLSDMRNRLGQQVYRSSRSTLQERDRVGRPLEDVVDLVG